MAFSLRQWIERSATLALAGEDMLTVPTLDPEETAETWAHHVMFEVSEGLASDSATHPLVETTVTVALTNGVGTLPSKVLINYLPKATVTRAGDATMARKLRYLPWHEFVRPLSTRFGSFSVRDGSEFNLVLPGATYTPGSGYTGNVSLITACAYDMPATESATISVPLKVEELLVRALAEKLVAKRRAAA